jgi:CRP-like cAMP-binding protein
MAPTWIAALKRTALFGSLTDTELADVAQQLAEIHFSQGETMFLAGEPGKGLFVVLKGKVRVFQNNADGREQVMHLDCDGAVIGTVPVFDDGCYPASATCKTDVDVLFIEKDVMRAYCAKYPQLAIMALRLMAELVRKHAQLVEVLSFHEVDQRLALFLLAEGRQVCTTIKSPLAFELSLSNQEIANRIGTVRDVVSRAFAQLRRDLLITKNGRTVVIPDLRALKIYAENAKKI